MPWLCVNQTRLAGPSDVPTPSLALDVQLCLRFPFPDINWSWQEYPLGYNVPVAVFALSAARCRYAVVGLNGEGVMSTTYQTLLQQFVPRLISSEPAYQRTLMQIDGLIRKAKRSRADDDLLELLATLVEQYQIRQGYTAAELSPRDRLAGLIKARQLTQTELSRASQVPRTTINEILASRRGISKANALRLANYFGVPAEEFITD
jgi:antitoxin component HigA of HigAB toxin-antitoxin module